MPKTSSDDDLTAPSPISPIYPSSPPVRKKQGQNPAEKVSPTSRDMSDDDDEQLSAIDPDEELNGGDDFDDLDVADDSNLSIPAEQQKQLAQVESSFRHSSPDPFRGAGIGDDADLSIVGGIRPAEPKGKKLAASRGAAGKRASDMGPPSLPASAYRKGKKGDSKPVTKSKLGRASIVAQDLSEASSPMADLPTGEDSSFSTRSENLESFSSPSTMAKARNISRTISSQYMTPKATKKSGLSSEIGSEDTTVRRPRLKTQRSRSSISSIGSEQVSDLDEDGQQRSAARSGGDFDFGFEEGGRRSSSHMANRRSVTRNASSGSIASTINANAAVEKVLDDLDEEGRSDSEEDVPVTPRARMTEETLPPETQLNAQIRNITVPETIARDFRRREASNGSFSPSKKPGGAGRGMTLKEQSGTIDKLQKENWDLRIKVFHLNNRLDKVSEESVKNLQNENGILAVENTQLKSHIKTLKKRIKQMEKSGDEGSSMRNGSDDMDGSKEEIRTLETEVIHWKEETERVEVEVETLRSKLKEKESQCERLSEVVRGMAGGGEEVETLRDFLDGEVQLRKQMEEANVKLRRENWDLKAAAAAGPAPSDPSVRTRSAMSTGSENTLVSQLRLENEDLRREVSAQLSMLTSRNREKERLYQEIEDLKLGIPRENNQLVHAAEYDHRAISRVSSNPLNMMADTEREDYENANGALRDKISEHKLKIQDLEIELETKLREFDKVIIQRQEFGDLAAEYEEELEVLNADLQVAIVERNEQLRLREELEQDFDNLKEEAEEEIQRLEEELDLRLHDIDRLEEDLRNKDENFGALQEEMRTLSNVVVRLEDSEQERIVKIQSLETDLEKSQKTINDNENEMTTLEKQLVELTNKSERLGVQQESAQGEIAFLREEQDGDKIKIGQLESQLKAIGENLKDEKERSRSLSDRLVEERKLMDETRNLNKQEVEKLLSEKNQEVLNMKEAARQLKKNLTRREAEVKEWKDKLAELENAMRETLGSISGSKSGILEGVVDLQRELEKRMDELSKAKSDLSDKDRTLKDRESLMENMALEARKLQELLDKERSGRKADKALAETLQANHEKSRRVISQHQSQLADLEKARSKDSKTLSQLEAQYKEQLAERNSLLVQLWSRLSALCGAEWADKNRLLGKGGVVQPAEAIVNNHLPGFTKATLAAVKNLEAILIGFKTKIRNIERDLWKEYAVVENTLETRTRRLERLEAMVRDGVGEQSAMRNEITKLKTENRLLKAELNVVRLQPSKLSIKGGNSNNASQDNLAVPVAAPPAAAPTAMVRAPSDPPAVATTPDTSAIAPISNTLASLDDVTDENERRWILRLRELEKRLKAEREARLLDRTGAKQRLEEARGEREQLKKELERERTIARINRDEEDDKKERRGSMIPKPKTIGSGRSRDIGGDSYVLPGIPGEDDDVRSLIVRVERERRAKSRDRHKSRERRSRETTEDRERSRDRDRGLGASTEAGRLRDRERDRLKERSGSDRASSNRSSTRRADSSASTSTKKINQASSIDELNARMERAKSPTTKKENSLSPRKFLGFFGSKGKDE